MAATYCPICHSSQLIFCPECGRTWRHGQGISYCTNPIEHDGDRSLYCNGCGRDVDREGVISDDQRLILYPYSATSMTMKWITTYDKQTK